MASKYLSETESYRLLANKLAELVTRMSKEEIRDRFGESHLYIYRMALNTLGHIAAAKRIEDAMPGSDPVG